MSEVLVTGATGTTGSRVAGYLAKRGVTARLATRTPHGDPSHVRFDWNDPGSYADALRAVSAVYLVAPVGVRDPVPPVERFLDTARRHGVRRVVVLGSSAVPEAATGMGGLYSLVREAMPEWAVLRPSWFMQNFTGDHPIAQGVRAGEIVTATGSGRIGFIDADDIAAVALRALIDDTPHNAEHILTGPQALGYADAAAIITELTARPVRHRPITASELAMHWVAGGFATDFADMLAALDEDIRNGAEDRVTDTVARLTGRPPRSFADFVAADLR